MKRLKSPFEPDPSKSHPAVRPDDKRLLAENVKNLGDAPLATQYAPGQSGNAGQTKKTALAKLEVKLQEYSKLKKMSYEDAINDVLVKGCIGQVRLTPSQLGAIQTLFKIRLGEGVESSGRPILIMQGPTQVVLEK